MVFALVCIGGFAMSMPAQGEQLPSQATADRGEWLPFAPAPAQPGGICMIDSGVEINPDTQTEIIAREALDGGNPGDVSPIKHGTLMAMEAAAPANGWGTIGTAPTAVRIVSIRAESASDSLAIGAYKQAIVTCQDLALRHPEYNLKVISMSIGFQGAPPPEQLAELEDAATGAHNAGLDLVAAAGDEGSQAISYPAAVPPILAIGASGQSRTQCSFSNGGDTAALLAPGCELEEANPISGAPITEYAGTSQATAITAAALAAVRAYEPQLGPQQAEHLLTSTAQSAGGSLDITALFQVAGLNSIIEAGRRNEPPQTPTLTSSSPTLAPSAQSSRLPRPWVSVHRRGHTLIIRLLNLPREGEAVVSVLGPRYHSHRVQLGRVATRHRVIRLRVQGKGLLQISYAPLGASRVGRSPAEVMGL